MSNLQAPSAVTMVRPHKFHPNPQTSLDNSFQTPVNDQDKTALAAKAYQQVTDMVEKLRGKGVQVHLFEDTQTATPDSVFPNNWFSTHSDGRVVLYPMFPVNRRDERRVDIIDNLQKQFKVQRVIDYSPWEKEAIFLEGTGAMVLDHHQRIAYTVKSNRADPQALAHFCLEFGYTPCLFDAADEQGVAVYHTNVMMCVGQQFAMIGASMIGCEIQRKKVLDLLEKSKESVIQLSEQQIAKFCANAIELTGSNGSILALSLCAYNALTCEQRKTLERHTELVPFDVSAIETAGGSVRCMLAGIHLEKA